MWDRGFGRNVRVLVRRASCPSSQGNGLETHGDFTRRFPSCRWQMVVVCWATGKRLTGRPPLFKPYNRSSYLQGVCGIKWVFFLNFDLTIECFCVRSWIKKPAVGMYHHDDHNFHFEVYNNSVGGVSWFWLEQRVDLRHFPTENTVVKRVITISVEYALHATHGSLPSVNY